ncbi:MAG: PAS domain S-box protein [ANME-2 cluster archaeon]|nr:PAS domain S-box protein [ANME-2 cluster archaeon]
MKYIPRSDSLKAKSILLIIIIVTVCISASALIASHLVHEQMTANYDNNKETTVESLSISLAPMLELYDYKLVERTITSTLEFDSVAYITVRDESGTLIRTSAKEDIPVESLDVVNVDIIGNEGLIGSLEIGFSNARINEHIRRTISALIFGLMGFFILAGVALYILVSRHIVEPLETFTKTIEGYSPGNISDRVKINRNDDIGALAASFNRMAENLEQADDKTQIALQKLKELEFIINQSQVIAFLWRNAEGWPVEFVSENIKQFGYTPQDFIDGDIAYTDIIHSDDMERVGNEVDMYSEQGITEFRQEYRIITKSGDIRWTDDVTWIRRDQNGNVTHYQGIVFDITERKRAEENLRDSEMKYSTLVEKGNDGIIIIQDGILKYVNSVMCEIAGFTKEEIVGKPFLDYVSLEYRDIVMERYEKRMMGNDVPNRYEIGIISKNGQTTPVEINATLIEYDDKPADMAIIRDNTEQKQIKDEMQKLNAELELRISERTADLQNNQQALVNVVEDLNVTTEELQNANKRLQELDRLKSMFIARTSHELRTPLNSIIGFTSILLEGWSGELNPEQTEQLEMVHTSGKHLLNLINDVIDISKIEAGKLDVFISEFKLREVMDEAVSVVRNDIDEKGLTLTVEVEDITLISDRRRLLQSILNLLSNAVKFTEKGNISIQTKSINSNINISVTDSGIGVKQEDIPKLFTPFVRLESPLTDRTSGTGLGLYLTKKLVMEALGGAVDVISEYGKGSTFTLIIPLKMEAQK